MYKEEKITIKERSIMATIKVKCSKCGNTFYMQDYERKTCPSCGTVAVGPKASTSTSDCCFITVCVKYAGLPDDCHELQVIRKFRDEYVRALPEGTTLIEDYYRTAPVIVQRIKLQKDSRDIFQKLLTALREVVALIQADRNSEALALCKRGFRLLKRRYRCKRAI